MESIFIMIAILLLFGVIVSGIRNATIKSELENLNVAFRKQINLNRTLQQEISNLSYDLRKEQEKYIFSAIYSTKTTSSQVDDTSKKLIALAVNNPNDNEARNAAIKACQRIYKNIK